MKHVREDLPDVQMRRPDVSAGLAAILDRMTDKHLEHRYPDARTLEADLEDALAVEAARSGRATGEATAVIATLPESARRRVPLPPPPPDPGPRRRRRAAAGRRRRRRRSCSRASSAPSAAPARARSRRRPAPGRLRQAHERPGLRPARRRRRARRRGLASPSTRTPARPGRPRATAAARSPARTASASTSTPRPSVAATQIEIDTPKPGWQAEIYVAARRPGARRRARRRQRVAEASAAAPSSASASASSSAPTASRTATTSSGSRSSPTGEERVEISDVSLFRKTARPRTRGPRAPRGSAPAPSASSRSHTAGNGRPLASHIFGKPLVAVMPGSVLSSLTSTRRRPRRRSRPAPAPSSPTRRNVSRASACTSAITSASDPRRDLELDPARRVLRLVVVPVGPLQHDLGRQRRLRLPVARHRALDLDPGRERLGDRQPVVLERRLQRPVELLRRRSPCGSPPTTRAAPA